MIQLDILLKDIANSGAQVPKAATVRAIIILDTLKLLARELTASTNMSEHFTNNTKPINSKTIVLTYSINSPILETL